MRPISFLACLSLAEIALSIPEAQQDTQSPNEALPFFAPSPRSTRPLFLDLLKRQSGCPSNYASCSSLSAPGLCCPTSTTCARDSAGNVACCPKNYVCTGVISGSASSSGASSTTQTTSNTGVVVGGTVTVTLTAGASGTTTSTSGTATTAANTPVTITAGSTVPNNYYPYAYIQTSFANSAVCLSAYSYCQAESTSCFNQLAGQNGVTVSNAVGSGGTTVAGASGILQTSASSICSSLSLTACYGLQSSQCQSLQSGTVASGNNVIVGAAERTAFPGVKYVAGVGLGIVAAGLAV